MGKLYISTGRHQQDQLFQLTHLRPVETGLPMVVWLSVRWQAKHNCIINIQTNHGEKVSPSNWVSITVDNNPKIVGKKSLLANDMPLVKKFILQNGNTICKYWNDEISTSEMLSSIVKIKA